MERLLVVLVVAAAALAVAWSVGRRRPAVVVPTGHHVPVQLHREDFADPTAPWLVAVFSSDTCATCAGVRAKVEALRSPSVAVDEVEVSARADLHARYGIDGVPTTVVADAAGVVRASFLGPVTATDLWAAVAELRQPGSIPPSCDHTHAGPGGGPAA